MSTTEGSRSGDRSARANEPCGVFSCGSCAVRRRQKIAQRAQHRGRSRRGSIVSARPYRAFAHLAADGACQVCTHSPPRSWPLELMLKFCADSRPLSRPPRLCAPRMVFFSFFCAQRRRAGRVAVSPVRWLSDGRHLPRVASGTATKRRPIARPQAGAQRGEAALECAGGKQG